MEHTRAQFELGGGSTYRGLDYCESCTLFIKIFKTEGGVFLALLRGKIRSRHKFIKVIFNLAQQRLYIGSIRISKVINR